MLLESTRIWLVSLISLFRLVGAIVFAWIAFKNVPVALIAGIYISAMASDVIDGYLARRLNAQTDFGKVLDLVCDKSLTIVSLLYAAGSGITILPLALIATREIIMIGARMILIEGTQLFPTNRNLGGMMWFLLWGNTVFLILTRHDTRLLVVANAIYWICAMMLLMNFIARIYGSTRRIRLSLSRDANGVQRDD
jgi:phosphatidylglycerophosphate synthase